MVTVSDSRVILYQNQIHHQTQATIQFPPDLDLKNQKSRGYPRIGPES